MGLTFVKKDLNMAAIQFLSLQNLKCLKIKTKHIGHLPKSVFGGNICVVIRLSIEKNSIFSKIF